MCEQFNIDDKTRFMVLYFDAQMNSHDISKIINRSVRTLEAWIIRINKGEDIRIRIPRKVRKRGITEEIENKVIQMLRENPEAASTTKLSARMGISRDSITKILNKKGYKYKAVVIDNKIKYSEEERMDRVDYCKKMLAYEGKLIYRSFFSDEMGIDLNRTHKTKAWQTPTEKVIKKNRENIKLNCWGAISAQGATSLDIYEKTTNGNTYREIIERHRAEMERLYSDGEFYFVQDNHPAHKVNEEWLIKEQKLELIKLPKRSPDLNIIENLWAALKERIKCDVPTNERELRASLLNNWEILTQTERLQPYFSGLHRRYIECVSKDGHKLPH